MESMTTLSESLSQTTQRSSHHEGSSSRLVYIRSDKYFKKDKSGNVDIKYKAILNPELILQNKAPILISCEEENINAYLSHANPTYKIDFHFLYDDVSRINFIPIANTVLLYNDELKIKKIYSSRKAATAGHTTFTGGLGLTRIQVRVENPMINYLVDSVIKLTKERKDIFLDDDFENRCRRQYTWVDQDYSQIYATMYNKICGSRVKDVTKIMKTRKASTSGVGLLRVRLLQIINPNYPIHWDLRFYIDRLEEEKYDKVNDSSLKVEA